VPTYHVPKPGDRPDVEVLVDDTRCPGELRMWTQDDDGTWAAQVQYQPPGTHTRVIGTFAADQVREDAVDRSRGREQRRRVVRSVTSVA
jgi:hypothetical protein